MEIILSVKWMFAGVCIVRKYTMRRRPKTNNVKIFLFYIFLVAFFSLKFKECALLFFSLSIETRNSFNKYYFNDAFPNAFFFPDNG